MGIANAVLPAAEVVSHARRMAERFNALPPGAVRESKALMRRGQQRWSRPCSVEGEIFRQRLRSPEAMEAFQAVLPEAQAGLLEVLSVGMSLAAKLLLSPILVAQALTTRARLPCLPEAAGDRAGVIGRGPLLRLLMLGDSSAAGVGVAEQGQALTGHCRARWRAWPKRACAGF